MTDPKRWLDDRAAAGSLEARILAVGSELTPPSGLLEQSFTEFAARVGLAGAGHDPSASAGNAAGAGQSAGLSAGAATAGASLTAGVLKAVGVGLLLGTLTMTSAQFLRGEPEGAEPLAARPAGPVGALRATPVAERSAISASPAPGSQLASDEASAPTSAREAGALRRGEPASMAARAATGGELIGEAATQAPRESVGSPVATGTAFAVESVPAPVALGSASPSAENSALRAEALELAQAKNLLQRGQASEALTLLVAGTKRFANGMLSDERELLIVQALSSLGRREQARQRALGFLASHAGSPISLRMQRLIEQK